MAKGKKTGGRDWKKGGYQPKNRGRPNVPADLREATKLTKANLEGMLNKYLWMPRSRIESVLQKDTNLPMIEYMIANIVTRAAVHGDTKRLDFILNRIIGKVKEEIDINTYSKQLETLTEDDFIELGKDAIRYLEVVNGAGT